MNTQPIIKEHLLMAEICVQGGLFQQASQELRSALRLANTHNTALKPPIFRALNVLRPLIQH